ncbi:MAG TPA: hypothetical protein VFN00_01900 [Arthrobacter sp.]|nr:hypothetical protein [Arthrobacter sp.]
MDIPTPPELEGQTSINELLDEPVGVDPVQLALPLFFLPAVPVQG